MRASDSSPRSRSALSALGMISAVGYSCRAAGVSSSDDGFSGGWVLSLVTAATQEPHIQRSGVVVMVPVNSSNGSAGLAGVGGWDAVVGLASRLELLAVRFVELAVVASAPFAVESGVPSGEVAAPLGAVSADGFGGEEVGPALIARPHRTHDLLYLSGTLKKRE
jgi:hypothetical protein